MRINTELILRCSSRNLLPSQSGDENPLQRITHLYLQEQHIKAIENLDMCINLIALYLYDNKIEKIENLECLKRISCIHLQNNRIGRLENLQDLTQLTVLNISYNAIQKIEGLESLSELRELYVQYQKLPQDQALELDPNSITGISENLRVLNISGNRLQSLIPLKSLVNLETFMAEDNDIHDLDELVDAISDWQFMHLMKLGGNPVCRQRKYRDNIAVTCLELEELDGRVISQSYRNFLLNWKQCQALQSRKKENYELLKPFLQEQIHNKQLSPPRPTPASSRPGSSSQSESSSTSAVRPRSKSMQRKDRSTSRTRSLQEMPMKLVKKLTRSRK